MQWKQRQRSAAPFLSVAPFVLLVVFAVSGLLLQTRLFQHYPASPRNMSILARSTRDMDLSYTQPCNCSKGQPPRSPAFLSDQPRLNHSLPFPVYYINMDKSMARRERMELDFGELWDLRRSPAVDGSNVSQVIGLMGQDNYDHIAPYIKEDRSSNTINRAELGCVLSHLITIRRSYTDGEAMAIIVEDDISPLLMPFWVASIEDLVGDAGHLNAFEGQPWDIIQLAWIWGLNEDLYDSIAERHGRGRQLARVRFQFGTSAYIISRSGMEKVLDLFFLDRSPHGLIRLQEGGRQAELYVAAAGNVLVTVPSLFTIEGSDTTISTGEEEQRRLRSHRESNSFHIKAMFDLYHAAQKERAS